MVLNVAINELFMTRKFVMFVYNWSSTQRLTEKVKGYNNKHILQCRLIDNSRSWCIPSICSPFYNGYYKQILVFYFFIFFLVYISTCNGCMSSVHALNWMGHEIGSRITLLGGYDHNHLIGRWKRELWSVSVVHSLLLPQDERLWFVINLAIVYGMAHACGLGLVCHTFF